MEAERIVGAPEQSVPRIMKRVEFENERSGQAETPGYDKFLTPTMQYRLEGFLGRLDELFDESPLTGSLWLRADGDSINRRFDCCFVGVPPGHWGPVDPDKQLEDFRRNGADDDRMSLEAIVRGSRLYVTARVIGPDRSKGLWSYNGTVGYRMPDVEEQFLDLEGSEKLVFHTDGVETPSADDYDQVFLDHDPVMNAALLFSEYALGPDDSLLSVVDV